MSDDFDPVDIAAQNAKKQEEHERLKRLHQEEISDMRWLMGRRQGRRIIYRQLADAGVWRSVFNTNAMTMAFNEGARNGGLKLVNLLMEACPDLWMQMIKENTDE